MVNLRIEARTPLTKMARARATVTAMTGPAGAALEDLSVVGGTDEVSLSAAGVATVELVTETAAGDPIIWEVIAGRIRRYLDLSSAAPDSTVDWGDDTYRVNEGPAPTDWVAVQGPPGVVAATGIATYDPGTQTVDVPGLLAGAQDATPAVEKAEDGDLWLAAGMYTAGEVKGGVIRRVTSIDTIWTSAPAVAPTDVAVGTAHRVKWDATITQPDIQTHSFGPRGVWSLEGIHELSANQTMYNFEPVMALDFMAIGNTPGQNRTQVPAWSYIGGRWRFADSATVTYAANDTNSGGAAFVDTPVWLTRNGGVIDGITNESAYASYLAGGVVGGNTNLFRKIGFELIDLAITNPGGTFDAPNVSVPQQIGLFVPHLTGGDENFGVWNGSATAEVPQAVTVTASSTIPRGATTYHLTSASVAINTSAPVIADGQPGERITVINVGAHAIALAGESAFSPLPAIPGSNLSQWVYLVPGASTTLMWTGASWDPVASYSPQVLSAAGQTLYRTLGGTHPVLGVGEVSGGGVVEWSSGLAAPDVRLNRTGVGLLSFGLGGFDTLPARRMTLPESLAPAAPPADNCTVFARDNGSGKTQLCVRFPTGAIQVISTEP